MSLPRKITVQSVVSSRYEPGSRPLSWDARTEGLEEIVTEEGETLILYSNGGQSTPAPGWVLMLVGEREESFEWTLFGIPAAESSADLSAENGSSAVNG